MLRNKIYYEYLKQEGIFPRSETPAGEMGYPFNKMLHIHIETTYLIIYMIYVFVKH